MNANRLSRYLFCVGTAALLGAAPSARAQDSARAEALQQTFAELRTPPPASASQIAVDETIPRKKATDEIEHQIDVAHVGAEQARVTLALRETDVHASESLLAHRKEDLDAATSREDEARKQFEKMRVQVQAQAPASPDDQSALGSFQENLAVAMEARKKADSAYRKQLAALEDAKTARDAAATALGNAQKTEADAVGAREKFLAQLINSDPEHAAALVQRNTIIVRLTPTATVADVKELLTRHPLLKVRSGIASIGMLVMGLPPTDGSSREELARLRKEVDALKKDTSIVSAAFLDRALGGNLIPPPSLDEPRWSWTNGSDPTKAWLLMNMPHAWDFSDAITRKGDAHIKVLVLDVGFHQHADLAFTPNVTVCLDHSEKHGNEVVGIIGAKHDGHGIDGGSPFVDITTCVPNLPPTVQAGSDQAARVSVVQVWFSYAITTLDYLLTNLNPKVVNASLGYNWWQTVARVGDEDPLIQTAVAEQGSLMREMLSRHPNVIVSAAAGNDCGSPCVELAKWTSPFNWAALASTGEDTVRHLPPSRNVFVVEGTDIDRNHAPNSNTGGSIAAPGDHIFTALDTNNDFGYDNGTSLAAPAITAIVALMYAYNPSLTVDDVRRILKVGQTKPPDQKADVPDAFAALSACRPPNEVAQDLAGITGNGQVASGGH